MHPAQAADNLADHLPDKDKAWVDAKLVKAFSHPDPEQGLRNAKHLAAQLDKRYPSAAASLREGLDETLTVLRLGVPPTLARTLRSTLLRSRCGRRSFTLSVNRPSEGRHALCR